MNNKIFNQLKDYSDANGVVTALDNNITMKLNAYGLYEESIIDETKIGEKLFSHIK